MPDAASVLLQRLQAAFDTIAPGADPVLRASDRADFQANGALPLGKVVGRPPRQVAEEVVAAASLDDICAEVEVSGPGFINLTLSDSFVAGLVAALSADERLGVDAGRRAPRPWSSTTRRPTWPRRCTSGTSAAPSSGTPWPACSGSSATTCGARTTSATGGRRSACSSSTCSTWTGRPTPSPSACGTSTSSTPRPAGSSTATPTSPSAAATASCCCRRATTRRCTSGASSSPSPCATPARSTSCSASS